MADSEIGGYIEPTPTPSTKYWVTDTQLQLLADAIRKEGGTTALLTYPDGFISAINSLNHVKTETLNASWPTEYNNIYWTTGTELQNIANAIKSKNSSSETLTFLNEFVNNLVLVNEDIPIVEYVHYRGATRQEDVYSNYLTYLFSFDATELILGNGTSDLYAPKDKNIFIKVNDASGIGATYPGIKFISSQNKNTILRNRDYNNIYGNMTMYQSDMGGSGWIIYQWRPSGEWPWNEDERIVAFYDANTDYA